MKVLVLEDSQAIRDLVCSAAENRGDHCFLAATIGEALAQFREHRPTIAFVDLHIPGQDSLEAIKALRRESSALVIISMTAFGSHENALRSLRLGANDYLKKPFRATELSATLDRYSKVIEETREERELTSFLKKKSFVIVMGNQLSHPGLVASYLADEATPFLPEEELLNVRLGIEELLMNAVEHGNLEISSEEKRHYMRQHGSIQKLIEQRCEEPGYKDRTVTIKADYNQDRCEWTITDEGSGFDFNNLPDPTEEKAVEELSGRGIFLARFQFSEIVYQGKGNKVLARWIRGKMNG